MTAPLTIHIGDRFGRLTVLDQGPNAPNGKRRFLCVCDCGQRRIVQAGNLRSGHSQSCGCLSAENSAAAHFKHGHARHYKVSKEFNTWSGMIDRCTNSNAAAFKHYGGRGIAVCREWSDSFAAFLRDVGPRPSAKHSIDRIDNDGNYEPGNVRWALKEVQNRNQRSNRQIEYKGRTQPLASWASELGLNYKAIHHQLKRGATVEEAFQQR